MGIVKYLNPKNLKTEIHRYGYHFSLGGYLKFLVLSYGGMIALSFWLGLKIAYIAVIAVAMTMLMPGIFLMTYGNMYEERKFEDITAYMEQLLYSFKRRAKILNALEDTLVLFRDGALHDAIQKSVSYIQNADTGGNIYKEAFLFIEEQYGCKRLYKIHDFLIRVEGTGGDFGGSADILLEDRRLWIERMYSLKKDKKNVQVKTTIGIGLSFLLCGMCVMMLPKEFGITQYMASQLATTAVILMNFLIWYLAQKKLSGSSLLSDQECSYEEIRKYYDYVKMGNRRKEKVKALAAALVLVPAMILAYIKFGLVSSACIGVAAAFLVSSPGRKYKFALKRVTKEVEKAFPEWLMGMSLQLQTDNVHVSLSKSIPEAPAILKEELYGLEEGIQEQPNDVYPYLNFMKQLDLPDVVSAMKMLYSMAEFGAGDTDKQIGALVQRNAVMTDKAERLRAEDYITGMSFLVLLPMITGVLKMLVDLVLVVLNLVSIVNTM